MTREQLLKDLIGDKALNIESDHTSKRNLKRKTPGKSLQTKTKNKSTRSNDDARQKNKKTPWSLRTRVSSSTHRNPRVPSAMTTLPPDECDCCILKLKTVVF